MRTEKKTGFKAELPGITTWPSQVVIINRRGMVIAAADDEASARQEARARIEARRQAARTSRAWIAARRADPAWGWAKELL